MIDVHCHLSYESFDKDRDDIIKKMQNSLKAVIDSATNISEAEKSLEMHKKYPKFIFSTLGLHPIHVIGLSEKEIENYMEFIKENKNKICGIGEIGLDSYHIKEKSDIQKTKDIFIRFIDFAKDLGKPLVIHARDAYEEALDVLEQEGAENVLMHMFGANQLVERVMKNGYFVSLNAIVLRSKKHRKVARDMPLESLLLETDAPWLHPEKGRNDPRTIRIVAEEIAEIKGLGFEEVWKACGRNSARFFRLPVKI